MPALDIEEEDSLRGQSQGTWERMDGAATLGEQNQGPIGVMGRGSSISLLSGLVSTVVSHSSTST